MNKINKVNKMSNQLNENLERNDLEDLVDGLFFVDRHVSKLGTDSEIVTLTFNVKGKEAANDLTGYIEKAFKWVLDADATPGPNQFGKHSVFVEIERSPKIVVRIQALLKEIENISGSLSWQFKYKKGAATMVADKATLEEIIPKTPDEYLDSIRSKAANSIKDFFADSNMHGIEVQEDGTVKLTKQVTEWAPKTVVGFKVNTVSTQKPQSISPSQLSRTVSGLLGENFVVEDIDNKFIIHNGKITLEVTNLYAEKN